MQARRAFTEVLGTELFWTEQGQGRPLVLLHGLHDSHRTWRRVAPDLARTRRVISVDLPGHGLSGRPDASYELAWHAEIIGGWMEALGLEDVDLVGHSFGGGVAQWLLLEHRARVRRLALVSSGGLGREVAFGLRLLASSRIVERWGQPFLALATRLAMSRFGASFDEEDVAALTWMHARPGTARALARTARDVIDWRGQRRGMLDRAREIGELPPIALYWGDRDNVVPFAHGAAMERMIDGVTLTRFAGCGHFPHHAHAEEFARALTGFLDAPDARPARIVSAPVVWRPPSPWRRAWSWVVGAFGRKPAAFAGN